MLHAQQDALTQYKDPGIDFVHMQDEGKAPDVFTLLRCGNKQPSLRLGKAELEL
jgi:hypothetical protein